ncbi:hypothetical protein DFQ27_003577 [Actinomortierella ambigua]|uniref:Uncharacterized protein n=1 Tax=Actinomortierella ambigua TaxID=1343610 RepID=A0A9P6Q6G5_9FUNG|nr:hypothetical protein DFQ27_003577 [Actinomortierella ambigua]
MSSLPLECLAHIVQFIETPGELYHVMRVNRVFFSRVARHLWYDPIGTVAKTRKPAISLLKLIRLIFAISPSEDTYVVKVRRLFEWVAGCNRPFHTPYHYRYVDILREPFSRTTPPLLDYLSFIRIFDVFAYMHFHGILRDTICVMLFWEEPYPTGEETEGEVWQEEIPTDRDMESTVDLLESSLVTAACGHRLSSLKRISVQYSQLDRYLENPPSSSSQTSSLPQRASIEEMVWSTASETEARRMLSLVPLFLQQYKGLHTIEFKLDRAPWRPMELLKVLPPLRALRVIDQSNLPRVLARWRDTDLSKVQELQLIYDYSLLANIKVVGELLTGRRRHAAATTTATTTATTATTATATTTYTDEVLSMCLAMFLQRLPLLRRLELWPYAHTMLAGVAQERRQCHTTNPWTRLSDLTVCCSLSEAEQIMSNAAIVFGNTLQKLAIRDGMPIEVDEELSSSSSLLMLMENSTQAIRIGQNCRVPLLSHLVVTGFSLKSLEIDPLFLANAVHLTHLELVTSGAEKGPPEGWSSRTQLSTLNTPSMRYLRLIGEPSWMFDPASLASMAPHLEYLELRDPSGITSNGPDHEDWCWETWDFPQIRELHLEGPPVAGYPWHKMVDCPNLKSVSLGTGDSQDMVVPWLDVVAAAGQGGSSVKSLLLKGMWQLGSPILESLLRDLCPQLTTLKLRRCEDLQCNDLLRAMTNYQHLRCIDTNWKADFATLRLEQDGGNTGNRASAERRRRIFFSGATHFLSE